MPTKQDQTPQKPVPQTQKKILRERNEYYESISVRLGLAQVILYLSLFAFVVLAFLSNTELVTYRNFYYFFQDLRASAETVDIFNAESVSYPTAEEQDFALYRGGLAVAGNHSVTLFSSTGRQLISTSIQYRNPRGVGDGKYLLVYEMGGTKYSLYNSNAQMYSGTTDRPITGAAVSENGMYALISSSDNAASTVTLYNNRFQLITRYNRTDYVTDVAIDSNGSNIAILTVASAQSELFSTLLLAVSGESALRAEIRLGSGMGLRCAFVTGGNVSVLTREAHHTFSSDGRELNTHVFDASEPALFEMNAAGTALVLKKNTISQKNIVIIFDKNGKIVYNDVVSEDIQEIRRFESAIFCMTDDGVLRLTTDGHTDFVAMQTEGRTLLAVSKNEVLCCSPQKAVYVFMQRK